VVREAFYRLPVRAAAWFVVGGQHVVRSDDWLSIGARRRDVSSAFTRDLFVETCTEWLLHGCPPIRELNPAAKVTDYDGNDVDVAATLQMADRRRDGARAVPAVPARVSSQNH